MFLPKKTSCIGASNLRRLQSYLCGTNEGTTPIRLIVVVKWDWVRTRPVL
jgi:hypothetical protein